MKYHLTFILLLVLSLHSFAQSDADTSSTNTPEGGISLRTNLVGWMMLQPNVGIEYKVSDRVGILADGGWAHWTINEKFWRMWNVAPQVRYYMGRFKDYYVGAEYKMGAYNFKKKQAKYAGGGVTIGHNFYLSEKVMVDFGLSLGYLRLYNREEYERIPADDLNYRKSPTTSKNYWGPTGVSVTFVWNLNKKTDK